MIIYVVKPGDSVFSIAQAYGTTSAKIISDNRLENPNQLAVGQTLVLMIDSIPHTVRSGQTIYSLARAYRVSPQAIIAANPQLTNPSRLSVGQVINIPITTPKLGTFEVNGYAFPNIKTDVLESTLPYLTYLSIFSYQVRPDGSLSTINDTPLIEAARAARVAPMMVITNIKEGGSFDTDLAHTILNSDEVQNTLINNILQTMQSKNYYGIDVDFEYIKGEDRENYNNFLRKLAERVRPLGYIVTTAVAPKTSATQPGLLYGGHDYKAHGEIADHVIIMTYEWGYTYAHTG